MKRLICALLFVLTAPALVAADWWTPYDQGVIAIEKQDWQRAVRQLEAAIAIDSAENNRATHRNRTVEYLPHYWLGVAKYHAGDLDGAIASWKTSQSQGKIQKTAQYSELRRWLSQAEAEKQQAKGAASEDARALADEALNKALSSQMQAVGAGADRDADFRTGQQRLQDAWKVFGAAGNNTTEYERAASMALEAGELFDKAVMRVKGGVAPQRPTLTTKAPGEGTASESIAPPPASPVEEEAAGETAEVSATPSESEVLVSTVPREVVEREIASARTDGDLLRRAWNYYAVGDTSASESLLTALIETGNASAEAHLLRGCVRYTRAMMLRDDELVADARADFVAALQRKPYLRLDDAHFSPRLIAFVDQVRSSL